METTWTIQSDGGKPFLSCEDDYKTGAAIWREVSEESMEYALNVLPPVYLNKGFMVGEPYTDDAGGVVRAAYTKVGVRWFSRYTTKSRYEADRQELLEALVRESAGL